MVCRIGILGGSGLYAMEAFEAKEEVRVETPFGDPSDVLITGTLAGVPIAFLPRHGRGHKLLPTEVPYRANIYALKQLGCCQVISISAVGSMLERIRPGDFVLVDQFIDRTRERPSTFFGRGVAAHVSFADPMCAGMREVLAGAGERAGATMHSGGAYLCMEGPQFSTRAESLVYRSWGVSVIGMTNLQEAKLAREAELCYQTVALATDYDCWHEGETAVSVEEVVATVRSNVAKAKRLIREAVAPLAARELACPCQNALRGAIMTATEAIPPEARTRLGLLINRHLE